MYFRVSTRTLASRYRNFQEGQVLFQIKTVDLPVEIDNKKDVIPGGTIYDVIGYEEGKYYVTNQEYKPGVPQLIPWIAARRITKASLNGDFKEKVENQTYSDGEVPKSHSLMVEKALKEIADENPGAYVYIDIYGDADKEWKSFNGSNLPSWTLKDGAIKKDFQNWTVMFQNWTVYVSYKGISAVALSKLRDLAKGLISLF